MRQPSEARAADPLPEYFLDHYGLCAIQPCACLRDGWRGRGCINWKPLGVTSHKELRVRLGITN